MEKQSRLNAYIDHDLYKKLKIHVATNDKTITKALEEAIKEYLENHK